MTWDFSCGTCMFQLRTREQHAHHTFLINVSLFAPSKTGTPLAPHCAHLQSTSDPYAQHSGVHFSHKQHLHLPCTPQKNPLSDWYITKISLSTRTCLVVRTYMRMYPCAVRHQFSILMNTAASTVDLSPFRHPTTPTNSKPSVLPSSCLLMCICTRKGIHVNATARRSHTSPTCNRQQINRQLSVPAYVQAHTPVHLHTRKHTHPQMMMILVCLAPHPSIAQCRG